jgi:cobalt-zinc-cadmium efflux system outer membrane protein
MRRVMAAALVVAGTVGLAVNARAQDEAPLAERFLDAAGGLTLDQAIAQALEREPSLRAVRAEVDVAAGFEQQARLRANPTVTVERRQTRDGMDRQSMITAQWPLELFRRGPRTEAAGHVRDGAAATVADRERLLAAGVRARYGDLLVSIRRLSVLDEIVAVVSEQYALISARVEEGAAPAIDRDLLDVELRRARAERLVALGRTDEAVVALNRMLGLPPEAPLRVRHRLADAVAQDLPPPVTAAEITARADVRAAAADVAASEARRDAARANGRIDISVMAGYGRMASGFMQQGIGPDGRLEPIRNRMHSFTGGVMVMVPLFDRNQGAVAAATAQRAAAGAALQAATLDAQAEIAAASAVDRRAHEALGLYDADGRALAQRNLDVVRQTYELGRATVFDVLAEQRRYLAFEEAYTEALRLAYEARTSLLSARGEVR